MKAALIAVAALAGVAGAQVKYLVSDDGTLYQGTVGGGVNTFSIGNAHLIGMTIVPAGVSVAGGGATGGDVIGIDDQDNANGRHDVYRVDNAFSGTPTLVRIGESDRVSNSLTFANGHLFGANGLGGTFRIHELDLTSFAGVADFTPGFAVTGVGGVSYSATDDLFYFVNNGADSLNTYDLNSNSAAFVGGSGTTFTNHGLEHIGTTLWGAIGDDAGTLEVGTWAKGSGTFTSMQTVAPYSGGGSHGVIGFVAIPAPGAMAVLGLGGLIAGRRRR